MHRRKFIRLSSASALAIVMGCQPHKNNTWEKSPFDIKLHSDMEIGHLVFSMKEASPTRKVRKQTLIVGAGLAGLSAAWQLKNHDYAICELSDRIGGSASSETFGNSVFPQGAHYDLDYPGYFGEEVLNMLETLNMVNYNAQTDLWQFTDRQYIIDYDYETQALYNAEYWDDVIPSEGEEFEQFMTLMESYSGQFKLPTRLVSPALHHLDKVPFFNYLEENIKLSSRFARGIDYQMIDDFGTNSKNVSAFAGIFYYAGRPYRGEHTETFSPPEGNAYFANQILSTLPQETIQLRHLVRRIIPNGKTIKAEVIHIETQKVIEYEVDNIIYAGQKHALKFVYPQDYPLFEKNMYAPWMVVSFVLDGSLHEKGYWQNEVISMEHNFLGFIDSDAQLANKENRVLTAYYCLPNWNREQLAKIKDTQQQIAQQTLENMASFFGMYPEEMRHKVKKVFIKVMGHGMPIPVPNYLFEDKNPKRSNPAMVYAGTDNSRLPLLFEALDSGIMAGKLIEGIKS